uniref:Uncharacterized protein n=1 Tax=Arundo donax TaxID=35708 RepID=A0A0A9EVI9_ARUDO
MVTTIVLTSMLYKPNIRAKTIGVALERVTMVTGPAAAGCKCPHGQRLVHCSVVGSQAGPSRCPGSAGEMPVDSWTMSGQHSKLSPAPRWQGIALLPRRRPLASQHSRSYQSTCSPRLSGHSVQLPSAAEGKRL